MLFQILLLGEHCLFLLLHRLLFLVQLTRALLEHAVDLREVAILAGNLLEKIFHGGIVAQLQGGIGTIDGGDGGLTFLTGSRHIAQRHSHGLSLTDQLGILLAQFFQLLVGNGEAFGSLGIVGLQRLVFAQGDTRRQTNDRRKQHEQLERLLHHIRFLFI